MTPPTKAWYARQERWKHNGFLGRVRMARTAMTAIQMSKTATPESKALSIEIEYALVKLGETLKTRNPGT